MAKIHVAGMEGREKFDPRTYDPWKDQKLSFLDIWLAESPAGKEEILDADDEVERITKLASSSGSDLYKGFETELAEIGSKSYDDVVNEQGQIELAEDTAEAAPKAKKATAFFPDF